MISIKDHSSGEARAGFAPRGVGKSRNEPGKVFVPGSRCTQLASQSQTNCMQEGFPVENVCLNGNLFDDALSGNLILQRGHSLRHGFRTDNCCSPRN